MKTKKAVIVFSGKVGSGKTTISTEIAYALGWEWLSFGNYIRKVAKEINLAEERKVLQDLGEQLLKQNLKTFCLNVLHQVTWQDKPLVIDGVRHREVIACLRDIVMPIPLFHIHIVVDEINQRGRILQREKESTIELIEAHSTEAQTSQILAESADLILDSTLPVDHLVKIIIKFLL